MQIHTHVQFFVYLTCGTLFTEMQTRGNILHIHNYDKVKKFVNKDEKRFLGNKVTKAFLQALEFLFYTHIHPSMVNI